MHSIESINSFGQISCKKRRRRMIQSSTYERKKTVDHLSRRGISCNERCLTSVFDYEDFYENKRAYFHRSSSTRHRHPTNDSYPCSMLILRR